jgi:hypothetical protein
MDSIERIGGNEHLLDNPIWEALTGVQKQFAEIRGCARKFPEEITALAGLHEPTTEAYELLASSLRPDEITAFLLDEFSELPVTGFQGAARVHPRSRTQPKTVVSCGDSSLTACRGYRNSNSMKYRRSVIPLPGGFSIVYRF